MQPPKADIVGFGESRIRGNIVALPRGIALLLGNADRLYACRSSARLGYRMIELYPRKRPAEAVYELRRSRGKREAAILIGDDDCSYLGERPDGLVVFCGMLDRIELWGADAWKSYWKREAASSSAVRDSLALFTRFGKERNEGAA